MERDGKEGLALVKNKGEKKSYVDKEKTCKQIYTMMKNKDVSVQQVSRLLGLSHQAVYGWIKGGRFPKLEHFYALKHILGTTLEQMIVPKED